MTELTSESFNEKVNNSKGKFLVDFYAPWCGECSALAVILDRVSQKTDNVEFFSFDCDSDRELVMNLGIMSIPALFLYENGKLINTKIGMMTEDELTDFINYSS